MLKQKLLKGKKTYLIPMFGFALIILIGTMLLALPCCNYGNVSLKDNLFVATSGLTTTGLLKSPIIINYSFLGQLVLAVLMEIGALGFIIFASYFWSIKNKKLKMSDMILINDSISSDSYASIKDHSKFVFKLMTRAQIIGIILLSFRFVPMLGVFRGIWYSIFHSISAFSNTGFDLFSGNSFYNFRYDIYVQVVLSGLMIIGSMGILVIEDIKNNKFKQFKRLKLQTKVVLVYSIFLLLIPAIIISVTEENVSFANAFFMSASSRSTGFSIVDLKNFSIENKIILTILMFIGGAPASTSGGIKIMVLAIIISTIISTLNGKNETVIFWRKISDSYIKKAFTIFMLFVCIIVIACFGFVYLNPMNILEIVFDSVSAVTNTGLSIMDFENLNLYGEIIFIILMFIGRIGPLSLVLTFIKGNARDKFIEYPSENVIL